MISLRLSGNIPGQIVRQAERAENSMRKLSSGARINRAADDAAGLSIAETMRSQVKGSQQAARNIQDGMQVLQIAEDGVSGILPILQRIRELVVQAGNATMGPTDREAIQAEIDDARGLFIDAFEVAVDTRRSLDGTPSDRILDFQVGADEGETVSVDFNPLRDELKDLIIRSFGYSDLFNNPKYHTFAEGVFGAPLPPPNAPVPPPPIFPPTPPGTTFDQFFPKELRVNPGTSANIARSLDLVSSKIEGVVLQATYIGGKVNGLERALNSVTNYEVNIAGAESQIRDTDMAKEMGEMTRAQVLQQTATAMFAQANVKSQAIMSLIKGQ